MTNLYLLFNNIPQGPGTQSFTNYSIEIIAMLLIAAILGYFFRYFLNERKNSEIRNNLLLQNKQILNLENELNSQKKKYTEIDSKYNIALSTNTQTNDELIVLQNRLNYSNDSLEKLEEKNESAKLDDSKWLKEKEGYTTKIESLKKEIKDNQSILRNLQKIQTKPQKATAKKVVLGKAAKSDIKKQPVNKKTSVKKVKAHPYTKLKETDLKIVEGIGPKIESLLHNAGITNWKSLSKSSISDIQKVLNEAGPRYKLAVPNTWPNQAKLASEKKWDELTEYQDFLEGGKDFT